MIQETIGKIEAKLKGNESMKPEAKSELLDLLGELKGEIGGLAKTNAEGAQTLAGFAAVSTHEATRAQKNPELLKLSIEGLSKSTEEFEESHPQLVAIVDRICTTLSNLGI